MAGRRRAAAVRGESCASAQPRDGRPDLGLASAATSLALVLSAGLLVSCGTPNPRILDSTEKAHIPERNEGAPLSEPDKIRKLFSIVRNSGHTFHQNGQDRDGPAAAADMERRLARIPAGVPTARQFVERVGAGRLRSKEGDTVTLDDESVVPTRDWLLARLAELEGAPVPADVAKQAAEARTNANTNTELGILDALTVVERSRLRFVAPPRRTPSGKLKGKRKEYTGVDFAEMLRKKWEFLGADIHDLDGFIKEIATDSFSSMEPYRVMHDDGHEEEFRTWLLEQLEARREAIAKGG